MSIQYPRWKLRKTENLSQGYITHKISCKAKEVYLYFLRKIDFVLRQICPFGFNYVHMYVGLCVQVHVHTKAKRGGSNPLEM